MLHRKDNETAECSQLHVALNLQGRVTGEQSRQMKELAAHISQLPKGLNKLTTNSQLTPTYASTPIIPKPMYYGDYAKCRGFLLQCKLYFCSSYANWGTKAHYIYYLSRWRGHEMGDGCNGKQHDQPQICAVSLITLQMERMSISICQGQSRVSGNTLEFCTIAVSGMRWRYKPYFGKDWIKLS